ncbi:MAG TPA: hypothetical protein VIX82_09595 [Solirubrobacteraceae bacterium]
MTIGIDRTRTLRGALCGAVAAALWAFEQPLDKVLLASSYDDVELLGKALISGEGAYPAGLVMHISNGALFGAVYSNLAPSVPLPVVLRGPALALAEHVLLWPLTAATDRFHPARDQLPTLAGNRRAFAQATLRHLLFGFALGELERRVNATADPVPLEPRADYSSNGHGSLERAVPLGS